MMAAAVSLAVVTGLFVVLLTVIATAAATVPAVVGIVMVTTAEQNRGQQGRGKCEDAFHNRRVFKGANGLRPATKVWQRDAGPFFLNRIRRVRRADYSILPASKLRIRVSFYWRPKRFAGTGWRAKPGPLISICGDPDGDACQ